MALVEDIHDEIHGWKLLGACAGHPDPVFYPERGYPATEARRICGGCPVKTECLDYAVVTKEKYGIWGGLTEQERRRLWKRRVSGN